MNERNTNSRKEGFGSTLAYIFRLIYVFAPLLILKLDLVISIFFLIIIMTVPVWGETLRFILYVWAFTVAIGRPIDYISVIFFICAALYLAEYVVKLLGKRKNRE